MLLNSTICVCMPPHTALRPWMHLSYMAMRILVSACFYIWELSLLALQWGSRRLWAWNVPLLYFTFKHAVNQPQSPVVELLKIMTYPVFDNKDGIQSLAHDRQTPHWGATPLFLFLSFKNSISLVPVQTTHLWHSCCLPNAGTTRMHLHTRAGN